MVSAGPDWLDELTRAWRSFRVGVLASRGYTKRAALVSTVDFRDPYLERALPALLYIKGAALLDEALALLVEMNGFELRGDYRNTLRGRLRYFRDHSILEVVRLEMIADRRNELAHEADARCSWSELGAACEEMERALVHLRLVSPTGELQDCTSSESTTDAIPPEVQFRVTFKYEVLEDGRPAETLTWVRDVLKPQR